MFSKKLKMPHTYTLLFGLIILIAVLTWVIPSGQFQKEEQLVSGMTKSVIVADTYEQVPKIDAEGKDLRQGPFDVLMAPSKGIQKSVEVIAFIFVLGGSFSILMKTGAIDSGVSVVARKFQGKEKIIIVLMMTLIGIGGSVIGTSEETIPFYMVFIPLMMSFGYDSLTAIMMIFLASQVGYVGATLNPFSVLVAQGVSGIQGNPQLWFRTIQFVVYMIITITFVLLYAKKVKNDPKKSLVYEEDLANRDFFLANRESLDKVEFTGRHKVILIGFAVSMGIMIWGLLEKGFYMNEIAAIFLMLGLFSGIVARFSEKDMAETFVEGCKDFAYPAVIIGIASAILVIAEDGMIIDTILNTLANSLKGMPVAVFTTIMLFVQNIIALFVPSSSGQAALTMPLMAPLGELIHVNKEAIVTTYQAGNGLTNMISPTGGVLMAALGIGRISLSKWIKSVAKIVIILEVTAAIFCAISAYLPI